MRTLAALLLAAALAGCSGKLDNPQPQLSAATATLKDGLVVAAVKAKLTADDPDSATTLGVSAHAGVVTLRGSVRTADARAKAVAAARSVSGVTEVVDALRVDPNARRPGEQISDFALAARISAALAAQVGFTHVSVRVERGVATLDGTVGDEKTKETALATARGTSGVRNVVDRIRVQRS